jgi:hypothetical protein
VEDAGRSLLDGVRHLAEEELDDCCLAEEELDDRLEPCEQPAHLALLVLAVKQVLTRLAQQVRQEPHQLEQEQVQVWEQLLRVQLVQQIELAAQMK